MVLLLSELQQVVFVKASSVWPDAVSTPSDGDPPAFCRLLLTLFISLLDLSHLLFAHAPALNVFKSQGEVRSKSVFYLMLRVYPVSELES